MDQPIEELEHEGFRIRIYPDDTGVDSPREWDNLGIMVCLHSRYKLGDRQELEYDEETALKYGGWEGLEKHLRRNGAVGPILPVGLLDHSGLHIYVGGGAHWTDSAGWDSGTIGFIYTTREQIEKLGAGFKCKACGEYVYHKPSPNTIEQRWLTAEGLRECFGDYNLTNDGEHNPNIEAALVNEIETYDQFLRGDVYGYVVDPMDKSLRDVPMPWITNNSYGDIIRDSCWGYYGIDECIAEAKSIAEAMKPDLDRAIAARTAKYAGGEVLEGAHA